MVDSYCVTTIMVYRIPSSHPSSRPGIHQTVEDVCGQVAERSPLEPLSTALSGHGRCILPNACHPRHERSMNASTLSGALRVLDNPPGTDDPACLPGDSANEAGRGVVFRPDLIGALVGPTRFGVPTREHTTARRSSPVPRDDAGLDRPPRPARDRCRSPQARPQLRDGRDCTADPACEYYEA